MKYSSIIVDELTPTRSSKFIPRCIILAFITGFIFYGFYSVIKVPTTELTSGHLESGSPLCNCFQEAARFDKQIVFYNRVPKCGSTTLIALMRKLAPINKFKHIHSKIYNRRKVDEEEQRRIVKWVESTSSPCSLDRHVFFINFTKFGERPPIYINVIRDPVERIISSFFYRRMVARQNKTSLKPSAYWLNKKFEHCVLAGDPECTLVEGQNNTLLQLPYFCGQDNICQNINDIDAVQKAKQNIEKHYAVVGTLEDMNKTLQVLEGTLPQFFKGAFQIYHNSGYHLNQNVQKGYVKEEIKALLKANLTAEYNLYHFVQQRLHLQFQKLSENTESEDGALDEQIDELLEW